MDKSIKPNAEQILRSAESILLVDWADAEVPRSLINAGFVVYSYSPGQYTHATLVEQIPDSSDEIAAPRHEHSFLTFDNLKESLNAVDIVNVYRPENELAGIIEKIILPLGAKTLWLHPPLTSELARGLAAKHCLEFVQGINIAETAINLQF